MNNRPLLGMPFGPSSSTVSGGSRLVISICGKKSGVCVAIFLFTVLCKKVMQQAEGGMSSMH